MSDNGGNKQRDNPSSSSQVDFKAKLASGLASLREYTTAEEIEALSTLSVYTRNLLVDRENDKYRRVKKSNVHFHDRLGYLTGSFACMRAIGYDDHGDYLRLDEMRMRGSDVTPRLEMIQKELQQRLATLERTFAEPPVHVPNDHAYTSVVAAACASEIGMRATMEDDEIIVDAFNGVPHQGFFAVYDGHGGRDTVDFVVRTLHASLAHLLRTSPEIPMAEAYRHVYLKTDAQLRRKGIIRSGTTAVTCLVRTEGKKRILYSANAGDARAVLIRNEVATRLTLDHKPTLQEETKRIVASGGYVAKGRVNGMLAVSRALGDHALKLNNNGIAADQSGKSNPNRVVGIIADPTCRTVELTDTDSFLIIACDGVWDVMSDQAAADFVGRKYTELIKAGATNKNMVLEDVSKALIKEALRLRTQDNVTVMVIKLV